MLTESKDKLFYGSSWMGYPVLSQYAPFIDRYLFKNLITIEAASRQYQKILAIRLDLHLPPEHDENDTSVISRFFESLNSQIYEDYVRHANRGVYLSGCRLRYIWAKERGHENGRIHYHLCIFLNHKRYAVLGKYVSSGLIDWREAQRNMAHRINKAWHNATNGAALPGHVEYPENAIYILQRNDPTYHHVKSDLFYRLSYLAKLWSKEQVAGRKYGASKG